MGYEDREYMRRGGFGGRPPGMPGPFEGAPVTKWLLIVNIAIALLDVAMTTGRVPSALRVWGAFNIEQGIYGGQIWRFLTFQFLHGGLGHVFFNSIALFFFGPHIERWMKSRAFLLFYLLCGVAGAAFYTFLFFVPGVLESNLTVTPMVGASAGIFGILAAFYYIAPEAKVYLFLIIPVKMKTLAIVVFVIEACIVLFDLRNSGGSAGHLGGAFLGLFILKNEGARAWLQQVVQPRAKKKAGRRRASRPAQIVREERRSPLELSKEVDRILDKIGEKGMQSLTKAERETLDKARKKS